MHKQSKLTISSKNVDVVAAAAAPTPAPRMPEATFSVLISGKAYSGKTTTVECLRPLLETLSDHTDGEIFLFVGNFADVLKEQCAKRAGVDLQLFYSQAGKNTMLPAPFNMTAGRFLQVYGESERERDPTVWVDHLLAKAWAAFSKSVGARYLLMLIGDCRHPNEIDSLRRSQREGLSVRLFGDPSASAALSTRDMNHISETALDDYDHFDLEIDTDTNDARLVTYAIWSTLLGQKFVWMDWRGTPLVVSDAMFETTLEGTGGEP